MRRAPFTLLFALLATPAPAQPQLKDDPQAAEMDALRAEVASQIQLQAYDLLDELVFEWTQHPVFDKDTPVVLADVSVPLSLGTGLQALVENHFASLLIANPSTRMRLSHCPQCTAVVVHSGAKGTVVSRGIDAPEALAETGWAGENKHAVFLDFEAEGASLVLRVRITRLVPDLPIVHARTLSSSSSSPALLRTGDHLVSAEQARKEYLDALENHGVLIVPLRLVVRSYQTANTGPASVPPFVWIQAGVEVAITQAREWTAGLSLGYSWAPNLHDGWLAQARTARLVSGKVRSLTRPDLYFFLGASALNIHGPDALLFSQTVPDVSDVVSAALGTRPQTTVFGWQFGLELRVRNRIGASVFLESIPALQNSPNLGNYLDLGLAKFQTMGAEVSFCF